MGCKSKTEQVAPELGRLDIKKIKTPQTPDSALTSSGENSAPHFSPDGRRILFVSKARPSHRNPQIYEMSLETYEEKRMTFSDGEEGTPLYNSAGTGFFYSSTTDELKERPLLLRKKGESDVFSPSEVYFRSLLVLDIERLTERAGFDGLIKPGLDKNEIFFTGLVDDKKQVFRLNIANKKATPIFADKKEDRREFVAAKAIWAWIITDPAHASVQRIKVATKTLTQSKIYDFGDAIYKDLKWLTLPDGAALLMTAAFKDHPQTMIMIFRPEQSCMATVLGSDKVSYSDPDLSPDLETLMFVSQGHIYRKKIDWTKVICDRTMPSADPIAPTATQTPASK